MADPTKKNPSGTPAAASPDPNVAQAPATGPQPVAPVGTGAAALAVANGGLPGGKARTDGFLPGSPEAAKADREKARLAKQKQRAKLARQTLPPPLPSAGAIARPPAPQTQNLDATPGQTIPVSFGGEDVEILPWQGEDCTPAVLDTLELLEEVDAIKIEGKLQKANLSAENQREILKDAKWPDRAKKGVGKYGGNCLAKALNAIGISAKNKDVVLIVPSLAYLFNDRAKLHRRLDKLIAAANAPANAQPKTP